MVAKHFSKYLLKKRKNKKELEKWLLFTFQLHYRLSYSDTKKKQNDPSRNWSPTLPFCPIKIEGKKRNEIQKFQKVDCQYKKPITRINIPPPFLFTGEKTSDRAHVHNKLFALDVIGTFRAYIKRDRVCGHTYSKEDREPLQEFWRYFILFHDKRLPLLDTIDRCMVVKNQTQQKMAGKRGDLENKNRSDVTFFHFLHQRRPTHTLWSHYTSTCVPNFHPPSKKNQQQHVVVI